MLEVAVTGLGVVSPFGVGRAAFQQGLAGARGPALVALPELAGTALAEQRVGQVPDLEAAASSLPGKQRKFMSQAALLGCLAGQEAWAMAQLEGRVAGPRIGLFAASGITASNFEAAAEMLAQCTGADGAFSERLLGERGLALMNPLDSFKILPNMPPCILSTLLGIRGPSLVFNPWEDQGAAALVEGLRAVAEGEVEAALVGAADTPSAPASCVYLRQCGRLLEGEFPIPAAAYLVLEASSSSRALAKLRLTPRAPGGTSADPLAARIGRSFAAAPALALVAACLETGGLLRLPGLPWDLQVLRP